jgi:hypothetical protein
MYNKFVKKKRKIDFKSSDNEMLMHDTTDCITISAWNNCIGHTDNLYEGKCCKELVTDEVLEPITIHTAEILSQSPSFECSDNGIKQASFFYYSFYINTNN